MGRAIQAKLPATLPTPAEARGNLHSSRDEVEKKRDVVDGMKESADLAKAELGEALEEVDEAETDLLAAAPSSPEELAADANHHKALARMEAAADDLAKVVAVQSRARAELKKAERKLAAARADLEAMRAGKRPSK